MRGLKIARHLEVGFGRIHHLLKQMTKGDPIGRASDSTLGREAAPPGSHYFELDGFSLTRADKKMGTRRSGFPTFDWIRWR
jgi:hypothetical protein